jgi:hypothetical protein
MGKWEFFEVGSRNGEVGMKRSGKEKDRRWEGEKVGRKR